MRSARHQLRIGEQHSMDAFGKSTLHAMLQERSLVQIARACLRQSDVVRNLPETVPAQASERVLRMMDLGRRTKEKQQIREPTLNLLESREPRLSLLQVPKGQQQEQGLVRSTHTSGSPHVELANPYQEVLSVHEANLDASRVPAQRKASATGGVCAMDDERGRRQLPQPRTGRTQVDAPASSSTNSSLFALGRNRTPI